MVGTAGSTLPKIGTRSACVEKLHSLIPNHMYHNFTVRNCNSRSSCTVRTNDYGFLEHLCIDEGKMKKKS